MEQIRLLPNTYIRHGKKKVQLYTKNLTPGKTVYDEETVTEKGIEYREWDPTRSKLGAAVLKQAAQIGIKEGDYILYLGASTGTTVSHVSDIVGKGGFVFALDIAPRVLRDLVFLAEERKNICPILADANKPLTYADKICSVDFVYQDVAQRNQAEIFLKNVNMFLKRDGLAFLAVKAKSIDIAKPVKMIYSEVRQMLEKDLVIVDQKILDPYEKDHCAFVCRKK